MMRPVLFVLPLMLALPAHADVLASNPSQIVEQIRAYGHKAKLVELPGDAPYIEAEGGGFTYWVDFYSCEGGSNCQDIQFNASFEISKQLPESFIARWSKDWALGAVHADDNGDAIISHYVIMSGGISEEAMQATINQWTGLLDTFQTELYR